MGLERAYAEVVFPRRWWVLGVGLQPLSIGHAILLQRSENRLGGLPGEAGREAGRGDLMEALWVCSRDWRRAAAGLGQRRQRIWCRLVPGWGMAHRLGLRQFGNYYGYFTEWPPVLRRVRGKGRAEIHAPLMHLLMLHGMRLGKTKAEALSTSVREALWDYVASLEERSGGEVGFESDREREQAAAAGELERELFGANPGAGAGPAAPGGQEKTEAAHGL